MNKQRREMDEFSIKISDNDKQDRSPGRSDKKRRKENEGGGCSGSSLPEGIDFYTVAASCAGRLSSWAGSFSSLRK